MFWVMLFGLIDTSAETRERRAIERALRNLRRSIRRDENGEIYVVGAYVVKDASSRPARVRPRDPAEASLTQVEPTDQDRELARRLLELKRGRNEDRARPRLSLRNEGRLKVG